MADQLSQDLASLRISRDEPPSRGGALKKIVTLLGVVGAALAIYVVGMPYLEAKVFRPEVRATEILIVSPAQSSVELTASGYVNAEKKSKVSAKVDGRIDKLFVEEGDELAAGAPIAELDSSQEESAIAAARARVLTAKARAEAARATLAETRTQANRQKLLVERGAAAKSTEEDLELRAKALEQLVYAGDAEVAAAEADVKSIAVTIALTKIVAPIKGRVIERAVDVGEMVGAHTGPIVELADFSTLIVEVDVPEGRLYRVKLKGPAEIVLDAYPGKRYRGEVGEIVPRVNRAKATVEVKVHFVDEPENVLPDMSARVSFLEKALDAEQMKEPPKTVVPEGAVVERAGAKVVFVLDTDQVRMKPVTLGEKFGPGYELKDGPAPGTKIIKNPPETMVDGQRVKERNN